MFCIDRRTRARSSTPRTPESLRARSLREPPPPLPPSPPPSLGDSSWRSIATLLRTTAALVGVCVILIGAVPIPLKRPGVVLLSGTIQSIDMSPTVLVLPVRRLLVLRCRAIAPDSGGDPAATLVGTGTDTGSGSGCIGGHMKGSRGTGWGVGVRETSGGRGGTAGERDERRDGPVREPSRFQADCGLSLSGEPERGPDGPPVNRGRGALCSSEAEKSTGSAPTSIVAVSVHFALIAAASKSPLGMFIGDKRRTRVGARPLLRTTETWLSDDARSSVSGAGRDFAGGDTRVGWSGMTTLDLREETGVCSSAFAIGVLGRGNGNGKVARDWRRETIIERRRVIVLCTSCGLEILARTPESLSLRVPFRKSLALSVSRMRNSSLRSGLKSTLSIYHIKQQRGDRTLL
jgi:hypothetical protein